MVAALSVRGLAWGPSRRIPILEDISFDVAPQEVLAIVGASGAGKSSLLNCLARASRPWRGEIELFGMDLWQMAPREASRRIAILPQSVPGIPADFPFRVRDVVMLGRTARGSPRAARNPADRAKVGAALERLDIAPLAERLFTTLSGGEKQRVLLARALAQEPQLLILDEPTGQLDIHHQLALLGVLRQLGVAIVATLHDLNLAAGFADRVLLLDHGRLRAAGPAEAVLTAEAIRGSFAVEAAIDRHPWMPAPRFSFHLGAEKP
jgi:iron complex transport system ATP-binding protein